MGSFIDSLAGSYPERQSNDKVETEKLHLVSVREKRGCLQNTHHCTLQVVRLAILDSVRNKEDGQRKSHRLDWRISLAGTIRSGAGGGMAHKTRIAETWAVPTQPSQG
jgi:hypothetical protein